MNYALAISQCNWVCEEGLPRLDRSDPPVKQNKQGYTNQTVGIILYRD